MQVPVELEFRLVAAEQHRQLAVSLDAKASRNNNWNNSTALAGALPRCLPLVKNDYTARQAPASHPAITV